jgi:hypothetical protein
LREWKYGFEIGHTPGETATGESAGVRRTGHVDDRRGLVIEHLCIRMYWNLGDELHEYPFADSH